MDSDRALLLFTSKVEKWISSLQKPMNEIGLRVQLHQKISALQQKHPMPEDSKNEVVDFLQSRALLANLALVLREIKSVCKEKLKSFTSSRAIAAIQAMEMSDCFSMVDKARAALMEAIVTYLNRYFAPDSPTLSLINVDRMLWGLEVALIAKYEKTVAHYMRLDESFAELFNVRHEVSSEALPDSSFEEFEYLFLDKSEEMKARVLEEMNRLTQGTIPRTVMYKYECEIYFYFQSEAERLMQKVYLPALWTTTRTQMDQIIHSEQQVPTIQLFDPSVCAPNLKLVVFNAVAAEVQWLRLSGDEEVIRNVTVAFGMQLSDALDRPRFTEEAAKLLPSILLPTKCAVSLFLLLAITGTFTRFCGAFADVQDVAHNYTPVRRILFRRVLRVFHIYLDECYLANIAESVLAEKLSDNHPMTAHDPDVLLQTVARYGAEEYERKRNSDSLKRTFAKMRGFLKRIYSVNPAKTHFSLTFYYQPVVTQSSLALTIVIPGWMSMGEDMEEKWSEIRDYAVPGRVTALAWDSDTIATAALSGGIGDFHKACHKAKFTGQQLARQLSESAFGTGPVSLIGFSLGSRIIYYALQELKLISDRVHVQDIVLLGGAAKNDPVAWTELLTLVAGRAVNVHSSKDLVLKHIYKVAMIGKPGPVGQGPIDCPRFENFDASSFILGHGEHVTKLHKTLQLINYQC